MNFAIFFNFTLATIHIEDLTVDNLAAILEIIWGDWKLNEKLHSMVHDNAASIKVAIRSLNNVKCCINCSAHTLQFCIKDTLNTVPEYRNVCIKASKIVSHFKHSNIATGALQKKKTDSPWFQGRTSYTKLSNTILSSWCVTLYIETAVQYVEY